MLQSGWLESTPRHRTSRWRGVLFVGGVHGRLWRMGWYADYPPGVSRRVRREMCMILWLSLSMFVIFGLFAWVVVHVGTQADD